MNAISLSLLTALSLSTSFVGMSAHAQDAPLLEWQKPRVPEGKEDVNPAEEAAAKKKQGNLGIVSGNLSPEVAAAANVKILTFRKPLDFDYEFSVLVVDGKIQRAFIISTNVDIDDEGKRHSAILGVHQITAETSGGDAILPGSPGRPFAFRTSHAYHSSPMYWSINIEGGFYIHSTPHYGNLGHPASMGCIRASIPDAMEIFNTVANVRSGEKSYMLIYPNMKLGTGSAGEKYLRQALTNSDWTIDDLKAALVRSKKEVAAVSKGDLAYPADGQPVQAHVRPYADQVQAESTFPTCGTNSDGSKINCWDYFIKQGVSISKRRILLNLKPSILASANYGKPPKTYKMSAASIPLQAPQKIEFSTVFGEDLSQSSPNIGNVTLTMSGFSGPLLVRICDQETKQCWTPRGPANGAHADSLYPMAQVADALRAGDHLFFDVKQGSGTLDAASVIFSP